jgi:hypothetical protein
LSQGLLDISWPNVLSKQNGDAAGKGVDADVRNVAAFTQHLRGMAQSLPPPCNVAPNPQSHSAGRLAEYLVLYRAVIRIRHV